MVYYSKALEKRCENHIAGWSSLVARRAHNPKVVRFKSHSRNQKENINQTVGVFLFAMLGKGMGFELGASNL